MPGSDLAVSPLCLGTAQAGDTLREKDFFYQLDAFWDMGGRFLDTANVYGRWLPVGENISEQLLGRWRKQNPHKDMIIATKGGHYDLITREKRLTLPALTHDIETSLAALGGEAIDLYYLHRDDPDLPVGVLLEWLTGFVKAGKLRFLAASNFTIKRMQEAAAYAAAHAVSPFIVLSNQYSLAALTPGQNTNPDPTLVICDREEWAYHEASGLPLIPYQSTARGYFAKRAAGRKIDPSLSAAYDNPANEAMLQDLILQSEKTGLSVQALSLVALVKSAPFPLIPIVGISAQSQLLDLAAAMEVLSCS